MALVDADYKFIWVDNGGNGAAGAVFSSMIYQIYILGMLNNGRKEAILNLIKLNFSRVHLPLEFHILFYDNGSAI